MADGPAHFFPMLYSLAVREKAQDLFICEGWSYVRIAQKLGVTTKTLQKWSKAEGWDNRCRQYQKSRQELRELLLSLKVKLAREALASGEARVVSALASLMRTDKDLNKKMQAGQQKPTAEDKQVSLEEAQRLARQVYDLEN